AFRWMLHRSGSSTSFGGLDGSDGVAGFLGFLPMSGLLGHGHPSQLRVPRNRVRFTASLTFTWRESGFPSPEARSDAVTAPTARAIILQRFIPGGRRSQPRPVPHILSCCHIVLLRTDRNHGFDFGRVKGWGGTGTAGFRKTVLIPLHSLLSAVGLPGRPRPRPAILARGVPPGLEL